MKGKNRWIFSFLFLMLIILSYSSTNIIAVNNNNDTLIIYGEVDNQNLDNRKVECVGNSFLYSVCVQFQGFLGMIVPGETIVTIPAIAESWTHSKNYTEWRVIIREGMKFHDGTPINAKAIKYSIYANLLTHFYFGFDNLSQSLDSKLITVSFPESDPTGEGREVLIYWDLVPGQLTEILICGGGMDLKSLFVLVPYGSHGEYNDNTSTCQMKQEEFSKFPISAGPYKLSEFKVGEYVSLERFDDWFGWGKSIKGSNGVFYTFPKKEQAFKHIRYEKKSSDIVNKVTTGTVDLSEGWGMTRNDLINSNNTEGVLTAIKPSTAGSFISLNIQGDWPTVFGGLGNYPLSTVWFRQAVSHAINRTYLVHEYHDGNAFEYDAIYPDWFLEQFPRINTSDYYDFTQGLIEAETILNMNNYIPLGFDEEPDNRFGYGPFANETSIEGQEQPRGRHFLLLTYDLLYSQAQIIQEDLKKVGIYVDIKAQDKHQTRVDMMDGVKPGEEYDITYYPDKDPEFMGPQWDFLMIHSITYPFENPWAIIQLNSFADWLMYSYSTQNPLLNGGWFNPDFEEAQAKSDGGWFEYLPYINEFVPSIPVQDYLIPEWSNNNTQFIEGCEVAGAEISRELPFIPLIWYSHSYVVNSRVKNFVFNREGLYHIAYSYRKTSQSTPYPIFSLNMIILLVILYSIKRKCME